MYRGLDHSTEHADQVALVYAHELGDEGLQMVHRLAADVESMFIVCGPAVGTEG